MILLIISTFSMPICHVVSAFFHYITEIYNIFLACTTSCYNAFYVIFKIFLSPRAGGGGVLVGNWKEIGTSKPE